jgi:predicted metal-dependent HD superfamily phosphohydrolase
VLAISPFFDFLQDLSKILPQIQGVGADLNILQQQVAEYVITSFETPNAPVYPYHNLQHTRNVVAHAGEIAGHYALNASDRFTVVTAAWFHDIGHLNGPMRGHEERGAAIMEQWLAGCRPGPEPDILNLIPTIRRCILATKFPSHPADLFEQIVCDADTYHLGTDYFRETDPLVRKEMAQRAGGKMPVNWKQKTLGFLRQHVFFTDYCQALLNEKKQANIAWFEAQPDA